MDDKTIAKALDLGEALERELRRDNTNPVLKALTLSARRGAIEAIRGLIELDPYDPTTPAVYARLQNEVRRFTDLIRWTIGTREAAEAAEQAYDLADHDERQAIEDLLLGPQTPRELNDA
jgi:hypothetical protein